jgi:integrase
MIEQEEPGGDLAGLVVPLAGRLVATGDRWEPYRLVDAGGVSVAAAGAYVGHLQAAGRSELTIRSYGMDVLRWFRFLWATGVPWNHAVRSDARDVCRWLQVAGKPVRPHWRKQDRHGAGQPAAASGVAYSPAVRAHCETVLRSFYDFHVEAGAGPLVNPFPLDRSRGAGRSHAHHNPAEPFRRERSGLYRPVVPSRVPRNVPDGEFNEIFAALGSHRDRALVAFYVSTGARASELLSATRGGVDPGRQVSPAATIRRMLTAALARTGLTGPAGAPLHYTLHDFRRMFLTDAIMSGLPPHIAQVIAGHRDINVTLGYKAVYPDEAIQAHLAFLARRRALRPTEEYRTPTEEEWAEFLGHFERRKVATGTCGRAFGTPCSHEHGTCAAPCTGPTPPSEPASPRSATT